MKQSTRRLLSTFLCVGALTGVMFISGCGSDDKGKTPDTPSVSAEKTDQSQMKNFNKLIDAISKYNEDITTWGESYGEVYDKMKNGTYQNGLRTPPFEQLQDALEKAKQGGDSFKEVDAERDNVLNVLNELVPLVKEFKAYDDSKGYLNDGGAKGKELAAKYVALADKFNAAYGTFDKTIKETNKEQTKKNIETMKKEGYKNYASAMEATLRFTDLVDEVEKTEKNPDKAKIEKEMNDIMAVINGIDKKDADSLKSTGNDLVGAIRQVMVDPNDRYQDRNIQRMIQRFNTYINAFNRLDPNKLDDVKK